MSLRQDVGGSKLDAAVLIHIVLRPLDEVLDMQREGPSPEPERGLPIRGGERRGDVGHAA